MPQFLQVILNIILFLVCLSLVVCIHEAGHLTIAKLCNVYCFEYSIGFGPLLFKHTFKHKRKKTDPLYDANKPDEKVPGETQFSIRALPLGGYVSMAGEDDPEPKDGQPVIIVPKERRINGVNHAKQIAIMMAGIVMNFILALILFFVAGILPQTTTVTSTNAVTVTESNDYPVYVAGLRTGDKILTLYQVYNNVVDTKGTSDATDDERVTLEYPKAENRVELTAYQKFTTDNPSSYDQLAHDCIQYAVMDIFAYRVNYSTDDSSTSQYTFPEEWKNCTIDALSTRTVYLTYQHNEGTEENPNWVSHDVIMGDIKTAENTADDNSIYYTYNPIGISCMTEPYQASFGEAVAYSFNRFGYCFTSIFQALGGLFTPSGWKNVGGIISVYKLSAAGTSSGSMAYFVFLWAYISVNLGVFNLLPFPGLDGWQTLMALIETVSRRKLPTKFKNIANTVGLIILLVLAALLVVKDIITL